MSEWKEVQLNETCNLIAGYAFKSKDFGNYPTKVLKIADINPPFVSSEKSSGVDLSNYDVDKLDKYIVKKGDYILAMTGATIGKLGRYVSDEHAYLNQRVLKFQPYKSIDSNFLYYVLCGRLFAKYIINHIDSESAQPNISAGTIGKYRFNLPDFKTQQEIASILSSLDSKIENNRKICANLEAQAQALFKHWFIDFAPFKDGKFVESELGMIPEGWRVTTIGKVCKCELGGTPSRANKSYWGGNIAWINSGEVNEFRICQASEYITDEGLSHSATKLLPTKTTVLAITGATLGQVSLLEINSCANQSVVGIKENGQIPYTFIYPLIKSKIYELILMQTGGAQQHINKDNIQSLKIVLSPDHIMSDYNFIVQEMYGQIGKLCFENLHLSSLRDTLLPKLMSGAIKV